MKTTLKLLFVIVCVLATQAAYSQTLEKYLIKRGVYNLCEAAHPANEYIDGTYNISTSTNGVDIHITSSDNVTGVQVRTELILLRGKGGIYFEDIWVLRDTDPWAKPFDAFTAQVQLTLASLKALLGEKAYDEMLTTFKNTFGSDLSKWTGKDWAVLVLNLDYYAYLLE